MLTNNPVKDSIIAMSNYILRCQDAEFLAALLGHGLASIYENCAWTRLAWMSPEEACLVAGPNTLRVRFRPFWDIFVNACDRRAAISRCLCFTNARALLLCNV